VIDEEAIFLGEKIKSFSNKRLLTLVKNLCGHEVKYGSGASLTLDDLTILETCILIIRHRSSRVFGFADPNSASYSPGEARRITNITEDDCS